MCHARKRGHRPAPATHEDLVRRVFAADAPNRVWFTDITQHRASDGWVYCCAVIDAYSRRIVGWSIADHIRTELVADALEMARWQRRPGRARSCTPTAAPSTPRGSSVTACATPACWDPWAESPHRWTTPSSSRSGPRCNASCSTDATGPHASTSPQRSSNGSRAGTTPPSPLHPGLSVPARVRGPSHRRHHRGMITTPKLSGKPGQAPLRPPPYRRSPDDPPLCASVRR